MELSGAGVTLPAFHQTLPPQPARCTGNTERAAVPVGEHCTAAFNQLRAALTEAPVLAFPEPQRLMWGLLECCSRRESTVNGWSPTSAARSADQGETTVLLLESCWLLSWELTTSEPTYLEDGSRCALIMPLSPGSSTSESWRGSWLGGSSLCKTATLRLCHRAARLHANADAPAAMWRRVVTALPVLWGLRVSELRGGCCVSRHPEG